ncbi:nestin-like isoform X3 [Oncorhynchus clarkii lewisi]
MGDFSSTNQLRSTYTSDGVPSSRGVKQSFQTQLATSHIISPFSTIHRASPRSNVTTMSASPIWTQNQVTLNETPESCRKTEEEQVDFDLGSNRQVIWSTPYPKVPQDGISVDHFRPQDVHEEVNYAEPLSPPTEEAGADVVSWLGSDHKEQSMWDLEKEEEDQNIVRTWVAKDKPVLEPAMSHQVEISFSMLTVFSTDAQELYSPSVSDERAGSVTGAHSAFSANDDNDVPFEMSSEKEEPLLDLPYGPMNALEERDRETARKDAEWVGKEGLESEIKSVLEPAFETFTSSQAFEYNKSKEFNQEDNMSYASTQASHGSEEAFHHVKRVEEDVINLTKEDDENYMSNKDEEQLEDELRPYGYGKDDCERLAGFNKEHCVTERIDKFNREAIISYESAQASHWSEEVFHHVERLEEGDIHFTKGDDENDMYNKREEQYALHPNGDVDDEWNRVGGYNEENGIRERMDEGKDQEGKDHMKEEEMWNNRETQPSQSDQEHIPSNVEKLNQFEQKHIPLGREKRNISDNDKEDHDEANYCQNTYVSWRAELEGDSYTQDNTLADTHPLIRYKSDETDANTQASHMGESDSSDGEQDREVCQTGSGTWGEGKSKQFDTMEDLYEESEGDVIDQESNMGSTHQEDMDASQTKEHATQENDEETAVDQLIQEAEEEQSYEELTEPGEYSMMCSDEDNNEERIDRLVEQELENLSISSYSEHFNGQMIESESVLSLQIESHTELSQTQDILYSEEVEQIHSERLNQSEQEHTTSGGEELNQSEQEHMTSGGEELNQSEQDHMTSDGEKLNQSEQEHTTSGGEKLNQSEQEHTTSGGEKLNQSEQEHTTSGGEKLNQSEQEHTTSGGEKLNQSEQEHTTSGGEKLNQSVQEYIPSDGEELNQSEQEHTTSGGEKLNQSEQEHTTSGGEKLNQSEQEHTTSGGEKLNQSEQEHTTSGGEKLNQSVQEYIPSDGEELNQSEQEYIPSDGEELNQSEPEYIPSGEEELNQSEPEYIPSGGEELNQSEPEYIPSGGEELNQSEPEYIPSGGEELNQSESEYIPSGGEELNQSEPEYIPSEVMYSMHSRIRMTPEHTSLRESSAEISKAEYLAQGKVFSEELGTEAVPDKIEGQDDQNLSMLTHADFTESHSIHSSLNSRPESQTNMNNSDIEESNSTDDESPNASQYLQRANEANLTADQVDLLDVAVSHYEDCNALIEHSAEEVTSYQASHECLQTDKWEVLESPNKHLESGDPFAGHKRNSERSSKTDSKGQDLHSFLSSGVHSNFWGSNLETGASYQPDEPYDHVTKLPNQNLALADNLSWVDLESTGSQLEHKDGQ